MLSKIYRLLEFSYENNNADKIPQMNFQVFLIAVKSLMPYEDNIGCMFDKSRHEKEIELFSLYKNGHDDIIEYYLKNKKPSEDEDKLLEYKVLPIIIANTIWENLIIEVMKAVTFYSINKKTIINAILLSSIVYEYLDDDNLDYENIIKRTKDRLIQFSIKELLENNKIELEKKHYIEFERERIKTLSQSDLITDENVKKFRSVMHIFNYQVKVEDEVAKEIVEQDNSILANYASYLQKLRKGTINPEKLKINLEKIPEFKEFLKSPVFNHPLLGKCKVVKKTEKEVILRNKSGLIKVNI